MKLIVQILAFVMPLILLLSCSDNSCYDNGSALPLVKFYASGTTTQVALVDVSIRGIDAPGDSILVDSETVSEVYLPLRVSVATTQWEFSYGGTYSDVSDTLTLTYKPIPYFASVECGAMYNFELSSVTMTSHLADSVAVAKPLIDNGMDVAIRLFYPTN